MDKPEGEDISPASSDAVGPTPGRTAGPGAGFAFSVGTPIAPRAPPRPA